MGQVKRVRAIFKANIKIILFYPIRKEFSNEVYSKNPKDLKFSQIKESPACRQASGASVSSESQESLNLPEKSKFVSKEMARGQGFEPRLPGPKPGVLPLDDPRIIK